MILHDFFDAAARFDDDALAAVLHPHARISEMPNAINPTGTERDLAQAREAFVRGRGLLASQAYDVHQVIEAGDTIAARATWRGTLAATGQELTAHIATFTQVRDGQIFRHATYDCYEPVAAPITAP
jgi:ketosteroid isomerase-like protein